ncbi:glycosyltransferase family 1 protein [Oryzobacter telluris]|uniref:glycosyltransferase family 1 protein n=1 Tax=Oryzobacter telluris TaxID=3149179 RepID=UPI00370D75E1
MGIRVVVGEFDAGTGWDPVTVMARLLARALGAELVSVPHRRLSSRAYPVVARAPRRRGPLTTIVVAPQPVHLYALLDVAHWLPGSGLTAGWVIDSFLLDRLPAVARRRRHFDHLFVTDAEMVRDWADATGITTSWLPWGSDVLGRGSGQVVRPVDLQRVGRQPETWSDDDDVARLLGTRGLVYSGRPPFVPDVDGNQAAVMGAMARAKMTLSFTNRLSPAGYTHHSREYLTGRWVDAVACGARVAGVAPRCAATERLLWTGATVDLGGVDRREGLARVEEAAAAWTPATPGSIHRRALAQVDWRWRFAELVEVLHLEAPVLEADLATMQGSGTPPAPPLRGPG